MNNRFIAAMLLALLITPAFAGSNFSYQQTQVQPAGSYYQQPLQYSTTQPLQGNVVMVPAGTSIPATFTTGISSSSVKAGEMVSTVLSSDYYYNNKLIAPAGSTITGTVIEASKAKRGSMNGKLSVRFTQIITPYGNLIPISAVIKTDDNSGVLVGGTKLDVTKDYAKDLVAGSAAGAVSGVVFGALAGGSVGKGAALGTAVGAGGGLIKSVWDKGDNVEIPANASVDLVLTQPVTIAASSYSYENQ